MSKSKYEDAASLKQTALLNLLKKNLNSHLSGQTLSNASGISRTAIWKHINNIRKMGYNIEVVSGKGYRLVGEMPFNEPEITGRLKTSFIGRPIYFHSNIDSTNTAAYDLALRGAKEGTAVVADSQEKGRGRLGRRWESPKGTNIYASIILRPDILPVFAPQLTLMGAVAVAETISKFLNNGSGCKPEPAVKWPNDILIDSKKVSGILTEMNSEMDRINFVIMGIGVNLNMKRNMFSQELRYIATSLKEETGKEIPRVEFIQSLYANLEKWYKIFLKKGFKPISEAWKGYFDMSGKRVTVHQANGNIMGIALTINEDGFLMVRESSGKVVKIISGDVRG